MQHLEAIILAGGEGSRFGGGKLLAPFHGGALIDGALRAAFAAPVAQIILVTGYDSENVGAATLALAGREPAAPVLRVVHAERYREGMAETLKVGIGALSKDADGAFVFLGDMPRVPLSLAKRLADGIAGRSAAAPFYRGRRGHPVLFASSLFPALLQLSGDQGARRLLDDLKDDLVLIDVDDAGVMFDVDRCSDLHA